MVLPKKITLHDFWPEGRGCLSLKVYTSLICLFISVFNLYLLSVFWWDSFWMFLHLDNSNFFDIFKHIPPSTFTESEAKISSMTCVKNICVWEKINWHANYSQPEWWKHRDSFHFGKPIAEITASQKYSIHSFSQSSRGSPKTKCPQYPSLWIYSWKIYLYVILSILKFWGWRTTIHSCSSKQK